MYRRWKKSMAIVLGGAVLVVAHAATPPVAEAKAPTGKVAVQTQRMTGPSLKTTQKGWYAKGRVLTLSCYQRGQAVKGYYSPYIRGGYDDLWYKVSDGYWVADVDINTGTNNPVTPKCGTAPAPTGRNGWSFPIRPHGTLTTYAGHDSATSGSDDIAAPAGTPIYAMKGGSATTRSITVGSWCPRGVPINGAQKEVLVTSVVNGVTYRFVYAHLSRFAAIGSTVKEGQVIGYVGQSGCATGNHVHVGVSRNGRVTHARDLLGTTRY